MFRRCLVIAVAASVIGCSSPRSPAEQEPSTQTCTNCHGDPANGNAAPPRSVAGATSTDDVRVGAHQQHLHASGIRAALTCDECHVVPQNVDDPGHIDKPTADLTWGPIASARGVTPTYQPSADGTTATCTNYCHGAAFAAGNGAVHAPVWTKVDGSQAGCGTCHGIPPPAPHPPAASATACATCHPATMNPDGSINVAGNRHINGIVDVVGSDGDCTGCHGDPNRTPALIAPAPPRDTTGNTATSAPGVGAHQVHLVGSALRASLPCDACHTVPTDLSHVNGVLDLTWGTLAGTGGVVPTFNAANATCTNYCHGLPAWGGTNTAPVWTGGATQAACGTCHGIAPADGRHQVPEHTVVSCGACHGRGYSSTSVVAATHVDGVKTVGGPSSVLLSWDPTPPGNCTTACHTNPTIPRTWYP